MHINNKTNQYYKADYTRSNKSDECPHTFERDSFDHVDGVCDKSEPFINVRQIVQIDSHGSLTTLL